MRTNAVPASVQQPFEQVLVANTAGKEVSLNIHGMGCWRCAHRIDHAISGMSGVLHVVVSLKDSSGIFIYDDKMINPPAIIKAIEGLGYTASVKR